MVNVYDYAHSLARALKDSEEYKAFQSARDRLKSRPAAEEMVRDFHKKQLDLQTLIYQGKEPSREQKEALERLAAIVQGDSVARDFLLAEQRFGVIIQDVYKILGDAIDMDVPGLERQ